MSNLTRITVDGRQISAELESPLLPVLRREGFDVPSMCWHDAVPPYGACRLCLVEVSQKGWKPEWRKLTTSCNFPVLEGLTVWVDTDKVRKHVATSLLLMLAQAPASSEVRALAARYGVGMEQVEADFDALERANLCIHCALCTRICDTLGHHAIATLGRGTGKHPGTPGDGPPPDCVGCAACAHVCPTGVIPVIEKDGKRTIWQRTFELVRCRQCGTTHITREQMEHAVGRTGLAASYFELCQECSRVAVATTMLENAP